MTIRELINTLTQIPKEHLDYGLLLVIVVVSEDNQWLQFAHLHAKGNSGYEVDGAFILDSAVERWMLDNIKDELFIYINDAISEYIGKYDLMLGDISNELDKKYSEGYNILAESVFEQLKERGVE